MTTTLSTAVFDAPVGTLTLVASDRGLVAILWPDDDPRRVPAVATASLVEDPDHPVLAETARQLAAYLAGERTDFDLPLDLRGTDLQRAVWTSLAGIPCGETDTYGALARRLGRPRAARAIGAAIGRNPVSIVLPCHRVVGANGALTGFAGGLDTKRWLLAHEAAIAGAPSGAARSAG